MTELTVVERESEWRRLKRLVLDAVSSPITRRVYNLALDEFIEWYDNERPCGFTKSAVNAWRLSLESRGLGSSSINGRLSGFANSPKKRPITGCLRQDSLSNLSRERYKDDRCSYAELAVATAGADTPECARYPYGEGSCVCQVLQLDWIS